MAIDPKTWRPRTRLVRGGIDRSAHGETSEALYLTQGYVYDGPARAEARFKGDEDGFVYSRYANPTVAMFEKRMALVEGAEAALATASGMAAVNAALMCQLQAGDHVVAHRSLFGSCRYLMEDLLPRFGVATTIIDGRTPEAWETARRASTRVFFFETPGNPTLDLVDIAAVAAIARPHGICVVVDNALASPAIQNPLEHGADIVAHSATKHVDGQGRCLGGVILGPREFIDKKAAPFCKHTGPSLSPFNAWVMVKSLETLALRADAQCAAAAQIADILAGADGVVSVTYPGRDDHPQAAIARAQMRAGGGVIALDVGGRAEAFAFLEALSLIDISNNFGDVKSLATHPATTTHQRIAPEVRAELGIGEGLVRLSIGLEDPRDLAEDLLAALDGLRRPLIRAAGA